MDALLSPTKRPRIHVAGTQDSAVGASSVAATCVSVSPLSPPHQSNSVQEECSGNSSSDDPLSFDPSMCPELVVVTQGMGALSLEESEKGDELQEKAIALAAQGENVFLTGKAGTGKSWTTRRIVSTLRSLHRTVHVAAPTGIAAISVGGTTIHAWGGFGLGEYYTDFDRMMDKKIRKKICATDTLVFDEVSMFAGHSFDVLECMVSIIRCYGEIANRVKDIRDRATIISEDEGGQSNSDSSRKPFMSLYMLKMRWADPASGGLGDLPSWGGMQLIAVGDFFQLPPVPNKSSAIGGTGGVLLQNEELWETEYNLKVGRQGCYAFQSHAWSRSKFFTVELQKVHRQAEDDGLLSLLNAMREGQMPLADELRTVLSAVCAPLPERNDGIVPTELHSMNSIVDEKNRAELAKIPEPVHDFKGKDEVELDYAYKQKLLSKHKLNNVAHMPYLWACVEEPLYPERWREVRAEISALEEKKKEFLAEEKYEELPGLRDTLKALEKEIREIEEGERRKAIITPLTISEWLKTANAADADSPLSIYGKVHGFQKQLRSDFAALTQHANERFFHKDCRVGSDIELKTKTQVMLLWNLDLDEKLANGSRGVVVCFVPLAEYRHLLQKELSKRGSSSCDDNDKGRGNRESKLSSSQQATSSEKSCDGEGSSVSEDPARERAAPAPPTAGSSSLDPMVLQRILKVLATMSHESIQKELLSADKAGSANVKELPFVQFTEGQTRVVVAQPFAKEFKGCGKAIRWQTPLTLAWAITMHKSQGMTVDWLRVNLAGCFSAGQAYVGCSRGRSVDKMVVENFSEQQIKTSQIVKRFYAALHSGTEIKIPTWEDSLANFEQTAASRARLKHVMTNTYGGRKCELCGAPCRVYMVTSNRNRGKWAVQCGQFYANGHTFEFVSVPSM